MRIQSSISVLTVISSLIVFSGSVNAEIFKWTDAQGKVHFGDSKPDTVKAESLKLEINTYTSVSYEEPNFNSANMGSEKPASAVLMNKVSLYSTAWCGHCKKARAYFKQNNIAYTEYDIEKDVTANKRYKKMGAKGVPVIIVGNKRMNGFSARGFERIYR